MDRMEFNGRVDMDLSQFFDPPGSSSKPAASGLEFDGSHELDFFSTINFMDFDGESTPLSAPPTLQTNLMGPDQFKQTAPAAPIAISESPSGQPIQQSAAAYPFSYSAIPGFTDMSSATYPIGQIPGSGLPSAITTPVDGRFASPAQLPTPSQDRAPRSARPAIPLASSETAESTMDLPDPSVDLGSMSMEVQARVSADEDKRRRNTAASARFRVKKKMREQEMEKTATEMTNKAHILEARVKQLEMENKWLRSLIVDKHGRVPKRAASSDPESQSGSDDSGSSNPSERSVDEHRPVARPTKRRSTSSKKSGSKKSTSTTVEFGPSASSSGYGQ